MKPSDHCVNCLRKRHAALALDTALALDRVASVKELERICSLNPPPRRKTGLIHFTLNLLKSFDNSGRRK